MIGHRTGPRRRHRFTECGENFSQRREPARHRQRLRDMDTHIARRRIVPLAAATALVIAACSSDDPDAGPSDTGTRTTDERIEIGPGDVELTSALIPFGECDSVLEHIKAEATERVGPWGLETGGPWGPMPFMDDVMMEGDVEMATDSPADLEAAEEGGARGNLAESEPATDEAGGDGSSPQAGVDYSETNLQEAGVDEPDILKTDGSRIVTLSNNVVTVVDVTSDAPRIVATAQIDAARAAEMFLVGDQLLVIGQGDNEVIHDGPVPQPVPEPLPVEPRDGETEVVVDAVDEPVDAEEEFVDDVVEAPPIEPGLEADIVEPYPGSYWVPTTQITVVDLSGSGAVVGESVEIEGTYLSARIVDGTARVVVASHPGQLPFLFPQGQAGEARAAEANKQIIDESTLDQWVPDFERRTADGTVIESGQLTDCSRMHRPTEFAGFNQLSVVGFDLGGNDLNPVDSTSVFANGETVYSSTESLYVATNQWFDTFPATEQDWLEENYSTSFHKFSLGDDGTANYEASGSVRGHILNQFALDEHDGRLRIATTDGTPWGQQDTTESFITVFEQNGDELEAVGSVGGLGRGERIFSVRFLEDEAYVVTFRQIDPFYVVDLSNPTQPAVVGELKIPGFSSYLHPIGDDLVLGVGQDADENGGTRGAKVSLFDVSDPANPVELDVWIDSGYSQSDVQWDHRAFTWWAPENAAILPLSSWDTQFFGAVVLDVTRSGIAERGRVEQNTGDEPAGQNDCVEIRRTGELPTWETAQDQLDYIYLEGGSVLACDPDQLAPDQVLPGHWCEGPASADEWRQWYGIDTQIQLETPVPDGSDVWFCWPEHYGGDPVVRTAVIGDDLWTMSYQSLQQNDLASLDRLLSLPIT